VKEVAKRPSKIRVLDYFSYSSSSSFSLSLSLSRERERERERERFVKNNLEST